MKILVTGTTGWLGAALAEALATDANNQVFGLARRDTAIDNVESIKADITSKEDMEKLTQQTNPPFDVVVHLAGAAGWCSLEQGLEINVAGTRNLVQACRTAGTTKFIIASSIAVTGTCSPHYPPKRLPITNDDGFVGSKWAYALSKHMVEQTIQFMSETESSPDVDYLLIRIGGVVTDPPGPMKHLETAVNEEWICHPAESAKDDGDDDNNNNSTKERIFPEFPLAAIALSDITKCLELAVKAPRKPGVRTITAVGPTAFTREPVADVMRSWYPNKEIDLSYHSIAGNEYDPIYDTESARNEIGFVAKLDLRKSNGLTS